MWRSRCLRAASLVAGLAFGLALTTGAPARAFPNGCYCGFWDFTNDQEFLIPEVPFGSIVEDCFEIKSQNRICSDFFGCGSFTKTSESGTRVTWVGLIKNIDYLDGGKIRITTGHGERRGPGAVIVGSTYTTDHFYSPTLRYPGTVEGAKSDPSECGAAL